MLQQQINAIKGSPPILNVEIQDYDTGKVLERAQVRLNEDTLSLRLRGVKVQAPLVGP